MFNKKETSTILKNDFADNMFFNVNNKNNHQKGDINDKIKPKRIREIKNNGEDFNEGYYMEGGYSNMVMANRKEDEEVSDFKGIIYKAINNEDKIKMNKGKHYNANQSDNSFFSNFPIEEQRLIVEKLNELDNLCKEESENLELMREKIKPLDSLLNDNTKYKGLQTFTIPSSLTFKNQQQKEKDEKSVSKIVDDLNIMQLDEDKSDVDDYINLSGSTITYTSPLTVNKDI